MDSHESAATAGRPDAPPSLRVTALATALLAAPALVAAAWPRLAEALAYDRAGIARGEAWRLVTCHWTHWSLEHLGWDLLAFAVLTPLCLRVGGPRRLRTALALSVVAVPLSAYALLPEMARYRGLSGLDSALFVLLASLLFLRQWRSGARGSAAVFALALAAFGLKVGYELSAGATVFVAAGDFVPVPLAHLAGGLCGAAVALLPGSRTAGISLQAGRRPRAS